MAMLALADAALTAAPTSPTYEACDEPAKSSARFCHTHPSPESEAIISGARIAPSRHRCSASVAGTC